MFHAPCMTIQHLNNAPPRQLLAFGDRSMAVQSAVESRAEHAAAMWRKFKRQPYIFVPSVQ